MSKAAYSKKEMIVIAAKALAAFVFPFFICLLFCAIRGGSLFRLYLPNSVNNDCLFYEKIVEGAVSFGSPRGFFGFNESHAQIGGFAAWSPVLFFPWILWGKIFGWNQYSAFISNMVFFGLSLAAFTVLVKPKLVNLLSFFLVLAMFPAFVVHLLNALPETVVASFMVLYYAFAFRAVRREKNTGSLVGMYVTGVILTLMRPYMVLLFLLPGVLFGKKKKALPSILVTAVIALLSVGGNMVISHFFTAEYFTPLYRTEILKLLLGGKIGQAFGLIVTTAKEMIPSIGYFVIGAFSFGSTAGSQYAVAIVSAVAALILGLSKKKKEYAPLNICFSVTVIVLLLMIIFLLQKANEGGRHLYVFAIAGVLVVCFNEWNVRSVVIRGVLVAMLGFFLSRGSIYPRDYDVPMENAALKEKVEYWEKTFREKNVAATKTIGYDNTVVWVLSDKTENGGKELPFGELFALPEGMGINGCFGDFVAKNAKTIKSRYVATVPGGTACENLQKEGWTEVGSTDTVVILERGQ